VITAAATSDVSAAEYWCGAVARHPERSFLRTGARDYTYAQFDDWVRVVAARLAERGVSPGDHVAIVLGSTPIHLAILAGLTLRGAVAVPLDPTHPVAELRELIERGGAGSVIADGVSRLPEALDVAALAAQPNEDDARATPEPDVAPTDPWAILFTSGSTSKPRGVIVPQRAFGVTGHALAQAHAYTGTDTILSVQPLHHASATLMSWAPCVAAGAALALVERFSVSGFWELVRTAGATAAIVVPTIAELLLAGPRSDRDRDHPLRLLVTHYDVPEFADRFGVEVRTLWGMTETSGLGLTRYAGDPVTRGGVGRPYPSDARLRLVDEAGLEVAPGEMGELLFTHPAVMIGYHGEPAPPDGWIRSGDLMRRLPDGGFAYLGRAKAVIKRGGENISAHELERVIADHPSVREVTVVSVPDPVFVEEACAIVVWASEPDAAGVRGYCRDRLADWKVPRYIAGWPDELPKLSNHKIDRGRVSAGLDLSSADDRGARTRPGRSSDV
jgi:crotonobetaine/carnitine-CoA ligase